MLLGRLVSGTCLVSNNHHLILSMRFSSFISTEYQEHIILKFKVLEELRKHNSDGDRKAKEIHI